MNDIAHAIPGYLGPADDLSSRIEAIGEEDVPAQWTPEHVQNRLVEAFKLVRRSPRVGPRTNANGWPEYLREFSDFTDLIEDEDLAERRAKITAAEASRMNEALAWPMQYLDGKPLAADALMTWAYAIASKRDMAALLAHRKKRAMALAEEMMKRRNALPHAGDCRSIADQWRAAQRQQIAKDVLDRTNRLLAQLGPECADQRSTIRVAARADLERECRTAGCLPYRTQPQEALPGRCLSRTNLDRQRKAAAEWVSRRLRRDNIAIR